MNGSLQIKNPPIFYCFVLFISSAADIVSGAYPMPSCPSLRLSVYQPFFQIEKAPTVLIQFFKYLA